MAPLVYSAGTSNISILTLVGGWISGALALFTLSLVLLGHLSHLGLDGYILLVATILALILACQATWAVLDEGQGQLMANVTASQTKLVIKVWISNA